MTSAVGQSGRWRRLLERARMGFRILACLGIATLLAPGFPLTGIPSGAAAQPAPGAQTAPAAKSAPAQPVIPPGGDEFTPRLELMLRTMRIARDWHVNRPAKPELIAGAVQGLLQRLDVEAEVYSRPELRLVSGTGSASGDLIGLEVRRDPAPRRQASRGYRVVSSRDGSPAARTGLKAGDLITHIGGRPASDMTYLSVMRTEFAGPVASSFALTLEREGATDPADVQLTRAPTDAAAVTVGSIAKDIAAIRIAAIEPAAAATLERELTALRDRLGGGLRGVVLDLRGTAGGSVAEAVALADLFLEQGIVLATEARNPRDAASNNATPGDAASGRPLVVLIDAGTAGPAEVLAAALQENKRARLIGHKSAGRGAVRTLRPLGRNGEKGALRIATSRLLTPLGKPIDGRGVTPDVTFEQTPADPACRPIDISDATAPGRCIRRNPAQDAQLERALGLLDEQLAAGTIAATPRP